MGETTKIQWTNKTWNPWHGCHKVSDGCKYCYMFRDKERYGQEPNTVLRSKSTFNEPLKWKEPEKIFTCSWSDWFIEEADEWRNEAWKIIKATPHLTYQILTKRPENIKDRLPADWGNGYSNVWLGVSVEKAKNKNRIDILRNVPANIRFVSFEPLLGSVGALNLDGINWAIIGGESGNTSGKYTFRECYLHWFHPIIWQCREQETSVFVKQLGTYLAKHFQLKDSHGGDMSEWPEDLQIREIPR